MYSHHSDKGTNTANTPKCKLNDVLVEIDGWRLVKPLYPQLISCQSYIVHMTCNADTRDPTSVQSVGTHAGMASHEGMSKTRGKCTWCGKSPPDEIRGLEILHNQEI